MLLKGKLGLLPSMHGDRKVLKAMFEADAEQRAQAKRQAQEKRQAADDGKGN